MIRRIRDNITTQQEPTDEIPNNAILSEGEHQAKSCGIFPFLLHLADFLIVCMTTGFKLFQYLQWQQLDFESVISFHLQCCSLSFQLCSSCIQVSRLWKWTPNWSFLVALCHHYVNHCVFSTIKAQVQETNHKQWHYSSFNITNYQKDYELYLRFNSLWNDQFFLF